MNFINFTNHEDAAAHTLINASLVGKLYSIACAIYSVVYTTFLVYFTLWCKLLNGQELTHLSLSDILSMLVLGTRRGEVMWMG